MDYKASKTIFILFSIVSFLTKYVDEIKEVPVLKIPLNEKTDSIIYYLYIFIFLFAFVHLIVERKNFKFTFEFPLIFLLFSTVSVSKFWLNLSPFLLEISTSLLMTFLTAYFSHISIEDLSFIRNKKKAKQLKLPRVPAAVRSVLIFSSLLTIILVSVWLYFAKNHFDYVFINKHYILITVVPFLVFLTFFLRDELCLRLKISNWEELKSRKVKLKKVYESHDRDYQQLGLIRTDLSPSNSQKISFFIKNDDIENIDKYYLEGNDPNELFGFGFTSLIFASAEGKIDSVKKIIEHGADLNIKNSKGRTALGFASRHNYHQIVEILLKKGANPNKSSLGTESPLQIAAIYGNEESVELLLKSDNIDINRKTLVTNQTALDLAMENGHGNIAKLIRKKLELT
jgi:hypothetical protein